MSNKNFNHNDNESFMEGIYGCLERIETAVFVVIKDKTQNCHIYFERRTEDNYH